MKITIFRCAFLLMLTLLVGSCKNEYERLRASNDNALILKKALEYYDQKDYVKAQSLFEIVMPNLRGAKDAETVYFKYAYTHYYLDKLITANHYFKSFASTYPNSSQREEADFMAAYALYEMSPGYRLDQSYTDKAIDGFQVFANTYPTSSRVKECNQLIDELRKKEEVKAFEEAKLYYDLNDYQSAIQVFDNLLKDFPETKNAEEMRYLAAAAAFKWAENSIYEKKEERYNKVIGLCETFKSKYLKSKYRKEVDVFQKTAVKQLKALQKL